MLLIQPLFFNKHIFPHMQKKSFFAGILIVIFSISVTGQNLKLHYNFQSANNSITDLTGNGYNATLKNGATIKTLSGISFLETGNNNGYLDLGAGTGSLINSLSDFSIATYVFIDRELNLNNNGNFVWTFSNAENILTNPSGCMFFSAKGSRYAISLTNYSTEKQVNIANPTAQDSWQHIVYRQNGSTGEIYINGVLQKSGTVSVLPSALGATAFNYLARASYAGDQYLKNSKYSDFRIYNSALTPTQITQLAANKLKLDTLIYKDMVDSALTKLSLGSLTSVAENLTLPATGIHATTISWQSSNTAVVANNGTVNRPASGQPNAHVTLTATVSKYFISKNISFNVTVLSQLSDAQSVNLDSDQLTLSGNLLNLRSNLSLPASGKEGSQIQWTSGDPVFLSNTGVILKRNAKGEGNKKVTLTATLTKGTVTTSKNFDIYIAEDEGYAAYLFAYFTGNNISQEAIRFALSNDGLVYKALNNDQPIIASSAISNTGGVRDPHILRGEDGMYYMVVTDMVSANGWNSNRGMVLLKSNDLVNWSSAKVHIPTAFPAQFSNVDRVWAPQTIYDKTTGKYLIYFSMRKGSGDYDKIYYAYANSSFTALETVPAQMFYHPDNQACIDGDIVEKNGLYHMFFKTEGSGNGIKKAVSNKLTEGWTLLDRYLDQNSNAVEGGCVFRLYNTDTWILMYDVYSSGYYEFTSSTDLENFSVMNGNSFDFSPRHGTVIPITAAEKAALNNKWGETTQAPQISQENEKPLWSLQANGIVLQNPEHIQKAEVFDIFGRKLLESKQPESKIAFHFGKSELYILKITTQSGKIYTDKILSTF